METQSHNLEPLENGSRKMSNGSIKPLKEEVIYKSQSIQLNKYTFEDENGKRKCAEGIKKCYVVDGHNRPDGAEGVLSVAILRRHILCDCLILIKQYRPTLKSYVLEFPAKIIDISESEKSGDLAARDVEESTGYRSTAVTYISPDTAMDPELCDTKLKLVSLEIDGDDPIRNNFFPSKKQARREMDMNSDSDSDGCEYDEIEVIQVPVNGLLDRLNEYSKRSIMVDSRVYAFAIGLKKGEKLALSMLNRENIMVE